MHHRALVFVTALAVMSFGCAGGKPVDIGENDAAKTGERLSDYAATWDGFVGAFHFPSGSDRIRLRSMPTVTARSRRATTSTTAPPTTAWLTRLRRTCTASRPSARCAKGSSTRCSDFETKLDGALDNPDTLNGTFVFIDAMTGNNRLTIHLTRQ